MNEFNAVMTRDGLLRIIGECSIAETRYYICVDAVTYDDEDERAELIEQGSYLLPVDSTTTFRVTKNNG